MRKEVATLPTFAETTTPGNYTIVETASEVAARLQHIATTRCAQCALVTIALSFTHTAHTPTIRMDRVATSTHYFLENLRSRVRKTDSVLLLHDTMYFILPDANLQGGQIVQERLWEALLWRVHNMEADILCPLSLRIGHSAYPEPVQHAEQCIAAACIAQKEFSLAPLTGIYTIPQDSDLSERARLLGIPYVALLPRTLPAKVWQLLRPELARELGCCPLGCTRNVLTVAMSNPDDSQALSRLHEATGLEIFPVLAHPQELAAALERYI